MRVLVSTLYLVGTPIGNLDDLSPRAVDTLKAVKLIACEHSNHTKKLLRHFNIQTPTTTFHQHNEHEKTNDLIEMLQQGDSIALVSDAGLPNMSDPGLPLIKEAHRQCMPVKVIPGPYAGACALIASGLPTIPHYFAGFLPPKSGQRQKALAALSSLSATLIFYEAPHRIHATVEDCLNVLGNRNCCLAREITKQYETLYTGLLSDIAQHTSKNLKGEMVLMVAGQAKQAPEDDKIIACITLLLNENIPLKNAVSLTCQITSAPKNLVYQLGKNITKNNEKH